MMKINEMIIARNITESKVGDKFKVKDINFEIEQNYTGCIRAITDIPVTDKDKTFFSSRQTAIEAYTAALPVQGYNVLIVNNIENARLELLQFINKKKQEIGIENISLDFDGNVYFIQISHGPGCKNH